MDANIMLEILEKEYGIFSMDDFEIELESFEGIDIGIFTSESNRETWRQME